MLNLVPDWAQHYGEFWKAIRIRNLWFIRLRYLAAIILLGFLLTGEFLLDLDFTLRQTVAISLITFLIILYNIAIQAVRKYVSADAKSFNGLHLSLIQMILDLTALMFLVHFTGTLESPLYMFFIFHMIIGSLILPGYIVYAAAGIISCVFALLTFLQRYNVIENHFIPGLYTGSRPHTLTYDILFVLIFGIMLFISVYIANKIAHQLYKREQELRSTLERLDEAEKTKQKYTIGIVHEIKTPITAVHSILELIKNGYLGPISEPVEQKIIRAEIRTEEALELIKNILSISKLRLLEIRLKDLINIGDALRNIIDTYSEMINEKSLKVIINDRREEDKPVKSDKVLFELIFSNLISNSIKYSEENGIVEIHVYEEADKFIIEISDSGIGIPQAEIDKIFDQFYRATNINRTLHEGSGMGLAVVKEIIVKLGGEIIVASPSCLESEGNPGTTFRIGIPYHHKTTENDIFEVNDEEYLNNKNNF
ncbi:MAG: hypothetical protein CVV24_13855 [Ignavibacteriae bacterium HGW-Ignavibacteriae-3]|nr:MAG: hypothetical protein CVV24_13855 [Ignavibacteriae bacterium HGW-Ignavibacteriae-3]